ncbi:MAG: TerC family protein [candidate division NC10 bacterium]|nr:TerC family protein [candidate division NC10 bacterium]
MADQWLWIIFGAVVLAMLVLDIGVFTRKPGMSLREAFVWSLAWVSLAGIFAVLVYMQKGPEKGLEFITGYVIEWSLSMDNLFVFLVIFSFFGLPEGSRPRVLFWGIMGAVVFRGVCIAAGAALLAHFEWILYIFGGFLVFTGLKLLRSGEDHIEPSRNPVLRLFRRFMAVTPDYHERHFFVRLDGHWLATPLVPVFIVIGTTDIIFAVDSIPAIFGITRDPFIVYTSNVFAVLGLRGLFFLLAGIMKLFRFLKFGISSVLVFVGIKMLVVDYYKIPAGVSLIVVAAILGASVLISLLLPAPGEPAATILASPGAEADGEGAWIAPPDAKHAAGLRPGGSAGA